MRIDEPGRHERWRVDLIVIEVGNHFDIWKKGRNFVARTDMGNARAVNHETTVLDDPQRTLGIGRIGITCDQALGENGKHF